VSNQPPSQPAQSPNDVEKQSVSPVVWLLLAYVWWFVATPDVRFPELGDIRFERILVALIVVAIMLNRAAPRPVAALSVLLVTFYLWMMVAFQLSPYKSGNEPQWWVDNYWKLMLLYFFILYGIRNLHDLAAVLCGIAGVSLFYQFHSWIDFLRGGSYVWQQGIARMVGVWSGGGIGAANNYGFLGMFTIPFVAFWLDIAKRPRTRTILFAALAMCFASVFSSGTRGALIVAGMLGFIYGWRYVGIKGIAIAAGLLLVVISFLPEGLRHRYVDQLIMTNTQQAFETQEEAIAAESAKGRIQGFKDGWNLALRRPVTGYGPGASPSAKKELPNYVIPMSERDEEGLTTQLHNLYGQVLSETGFVGGGIFLVIVLTYVGQLRGLDVSDKDPSREMEIIRAARRALLLIMLALLVYGMATHNLYRYIWLIIFACQAALVLLARRWEIDRFARQLAEKKRAAQIASSPDPDFRSAGVDEARTNSRNPV